MARVASGSVARQIESLFDVGSMAGLTDRQLVERFTASGRDAAGEAAFAALVARHGPMVLGVCRQLLGDVQDAEDTFQGVFLVLARRAQSIRDPDLLGNWLYGVAIRTARCARQQIGRRRRREESGPMTGVGTGSSDRAEPAAPPADRPAIDREQAEAIHGEVVDALPRAFRLPVVLCYFEGLTLDDAARRLRCPAGTVRSRLARAREKLKIGLARRGVALPAVALGAVLSPRSASASIPPLLCDSTTRAAIQFAAQHTAAGGAISTSAAALAQEVLRTMLLHKVKLIASSLLLMAAVATAELARPFAGHEGFAREESGTPGGASRAACRRPDQSRRETRSCRRRSDDGRRPGARPRRQAPRSAVVDLVSRPRSPWVGASDDIDRYTLLGKGQSGGDGRFKLDSPRTASTRVFDVFVVAAAPGFGLGWAALNPDAEQPLAEIKLQPEKAVRLRLTDVTGTPAKGVEVALRSVGRSNDKGQFDGISFGTSARGGIRVWPRPVKSDDQGRITLAGIGRGALVSLGVTDLRYARQDLHVDPAKALSSGEITIALEPARIIEGRVLAADTGEPIKNAEPVSRLYALLMNEHSRGYFTAKFRADDQGRFVMNPAASDTYTLGAFVTGGEPYLIQQDEFKWTKGTVKATHDIKLKRGALIRGKVTEAGTDRPLTASSIQFIPVRGDDQVLSGWQAIVASKDDGSFQIAVPSGKGHLLVFGPTGDYVLGEIGSNRLYSDRPGGQRYHAHAIIPYEVKAGDPPIEVAAALRPGVTIKGRVEGPDGQTITDGFILTTLRIEAFNPFWRGDYQIAIRDGRFELHGLAADAFTRIYLLDPEHEWGASVEVSGKQVTEDLVIRLQPCGKAVARFVGPDGHGLAKHSPHFEIVVTPGPSTISRDKREQTDAGGRRVARRQCRPQALLELARRRCRRSHHPDLTDSRCDVPDHRLLYCQRRTEGCSDSQELLGQTWRDARPGGYHDR